MSSDLSSIEVDGKEIADALVFENGIPLLQFDTVRWWINCNTRGDDAREAWTCVQRTWLSQLGESLGERYEVFQSERALVLGRMKRVVGTFVAGRVENTLTTLDQLLPGVVEHSVSGKHLVICLAEESEVGRYSAAVGCGTDWAGICIGREPVHVLLKGSKGVSEVLLAHELAHACLHHLELPRWLDEGIAQRMERFITQRPYGELSESQKAPWRADDLSGFWSGRWFRDPATVESAYKLSEFLLHQICVSKATRLAQFICNAKREDGGHAAAVEHLGRELEDFLRDLLDPPAPPPSPAARLFRRLMGRE